MVLESRTRTGDLGEDCAVHRLESMGYRILTQNWRGKRGEVDVIARDDDHVAGRTAGPVSVECWRAVPLPHHETQP